VGPARALPENALCHRCALAALSLCMLLSSLGTSIANVSLPTLAQAFQASFQEVQWVVLAYLVTVTALTVSAGRLGDLMGRRRVLLLGLILFIAASGLCGASPGLGLLTAARAAQGAGAAILLSLAIALVREAVPTEKTGSAMGLLGTMSAVGTAMGPSLGGFLIDGFGWRSIFLVNVPIGILAWMLAHRGLAADVPRPGNTSTRFDTRGTLLLAMTLVAYALAMTLGRGTFGPRNVALLFAAFLLAGIFLLAERNAEAPLIRLTILREPVLRAGLAMSTLVSTVMMATLVVGPFYLTQALELDAARVGLILSAGPLAVALTGMPAGRMVDRFGPRAMTVIGLGAMTLGTLFLSMLPRSFAIPGYLGPIVVVTVGYGLFQTANNTAVMHDILPEQRGLISGMLNLSRNLGLITGASVMGAAFAFAAGSPDLRSADSDSIAHAMRVTFAMATALIALALAIALGSRRAEGS
jgi:EmrB/QacA subfamily drug resistance transporter